jgi:diguanylate cyclase (GGDEF)-like protein
MTHIMAKSRKLPGRAANANVAPVAPARAGVVDDGPGTMAAVSTISSPVARLSTEVERVQAEFTALQARLVDMQAKLAELEAKVDVDPLLDVFNRQGFERELKRALAYVQRYGTRAALIYLDLDGFKAINDTHGHAAGDAMLQAVAEMLTRQIRGSDTVARVGGDEFVVLLWELGESDAMIKATGLEEAIEAVHYTWGETTLSVGASAGVAMILPGDEPAAVLVRADQAMYARKANRKRAREGVNV